jgi:hypothetical protein
MPGPEWIKLWEASLRLERWLFSRVLCEQATENAVQSGRIDVRGMKYGGAVRFVPELIEITERMRVTVWSSTISVEHRPLWTELEVNWPVFLEYCRKYAFPAGTPDQEDGELHEGPGRKTAAETRKQEMLAEFERMPVDGHHGEQTACAEKLHKKFKKYKVDTIKRMIRQRWKEKTKSGRKTWTKN